MKIKIVFVIIVMALLSCIGRILKPSPNLIEGTWQLIKGTLTEKGDTVTQHSMSGFNGRP
jgi:hypothetical protein